MKPLTGFTQRMFYIGVNASVKEFNLPPIEKELTDSVLEGDAGAVAMLFNKTCGVNKNVSLWLIGLLLNDQTLILNSIYDLSEEIGFDSELSVAITEIAINLYNIINYSNWTYIVSRYLKINFDLQNIFILDSNYSELKMRKHILKISLT